MEHLSTWRHLEAPGLEPTGEKFQFVLAAEEEHDEETES